MTEFGRGYATCLLQFVFHEPRLESLTGKEKQDVELWANGASDHLYDLITGGRIKKEYRLRADALVKEALECGHGWNSDLNWTFAQARGWLAEAKELLDAVGSPKTIKKAMDIDRKLGLRPELGITCEKPFERNT